MVAGLEALGLRDAFDVVYGSSAGACAGAYFLAGQARPGTRVYYEVVNSRQFINPLRGLQRRPILDLDAMFVALRRKVPLDFAEIQRSGVELVVLASHVDVEAAAGVRPNGPRVIVEAVRFSEFTDGDDLFGALHASSRMPIVGGAPFTYRGMRYWDASVTQPVPVHAALADGCSHVLVLLTLPRDTAPGRMSLLDRLLLAPRVASVSPVLAEMYRTRAERYRETWQLVLKQSVGRHGPPYVEGIVADASTPVIGRTEIRAARLIAAGRGGGDAVLAAFGRADARLNDQMVAVHRDGQPIDVRLMRAPAS
jgi:predicted patatin/cPLA2 family phospholipase